MSHIRIREENQADSSKKLSVVSKCLAIVLIPKSHRDSLDVFDNSDANETIVDGADVTIQSSSEVIKAVSSIGYNGKELLQDFKIRNKTCYWNPSLVESIKSLEYKGFVEPSTILVTAADIHLENLRSAWGRRVLKPPAGFIIDRIGDVDGIQMQIVPQTQFMPLPDALCSIIMNLNLRRIVATLEVIMEKLTLWYKDMTVPTHQLIFETLGTLIKDRKVFHTGSGYFVVTPETGQLQNSMNTSYLPSNASWLPYHPMYVPVFQGELPVLPSRIHMRSISCQVTTIEESSEEEADKDEKKDKDGISNLVGQQPDGLKPKPAKEEVKEAKNVKGDNKAETVHAEFKVPSAYKSKEEKMKGVKDEKLKPGNGCQAKVKGEKTSLFSKLFNRKKNKDKDRSLMPPPPTPVGPISVITSTSSSDAMSEGKEEKEYATFSGQFPPIEWVWYRQQLEKQERIKTWVSEQSTNIINPNLLPKVSALPPMGKRSYALNENIQQTSRKSLLHLDHMHADYIPMSSLEEKDTKIMKQDRDGVFVKPRPVKPENIYESFSTASSVRYYNQEQKPLGVYRMQYQRSSEYSVINPCDVTPVNNSNIYQSISALSPVARLHEESLCSKLVVQPPLGPLHSTPLCGQNDRTAYRVDGHEARDRIFGPPDNYHKRKSHRSRRRHQRAYSYYNGHGSDISYEYKGSLPNKNSSRTQSRDSGVNCVGLNRPPEHHDKIGTDSVYENTTSRHHNQRLRSSQHQRRHAHHHHLAGNSAQFEVNATDSENSHINLNIVDSTTSSAAYQSNITNAAYNSVVYGSLSDMTGEHSVMRHTITDSDIQSSGMPIPQNSLHSAFYEDSTMGSTSSLPRFSHMNPKTSQGFPGPTSSPETVIVDVVGSQSEGDSDGMLEPASDTETSKMGASIKCNAIFDAHKTRLTRMQAVEHAEVCNENGDEDSSNDPCDCQRAVHREDKEKNDHSDQFDCVKSTGLSQSVIPPSSRREGMSEKSVLDSGFSSPRNPDKPEGGDKTSNYSNSSRENIGEGNTYPQNNNQSSSDCNNTPQSSTSGTSSLHSSSDVCKSAGNESTSKSSTAVSGQRDCKQTTLPKHVSKMTHGCSLNSLKSQVQHSQPLSQQYLQHAPNSQLQQHIVHHKKPAAKDVHHHDTCAIAGSTIYRDQNHPARVPLHANSIHKPHHTNKPQPARSHSVDFWKSANDLQQFEGQQMSNRFGDEFEVMGVL